MLNFEPLRENTKTVADLVAGLTVEDLRVLTDEMIDTIWGLIEHCRDEDVTFEPMDPEAYDPYAERPKDVDLAWNLGHVIVHITASAEESAFLAAEMARGVPNHGRSRYEVPWEQINTLEVCRLRLEESRRMRLASLDLWPDEPHLENVYQAWKGGPKVNAVGRFVLGLKHDDDHLNQICAIVQQAEVARQGK